MLLSQWSDNYRKLSKEASAEPGQFHTSKAPYQREIMDCQHEYGVTGAVCIKSSQVGLSEIFLNDIGYTIDYKPCPMLVVLPTKDLMEEFGKDRIKPLIRDNPRVKRRIRANESTLTNYRFEGGFLALASANTPRSLAGKPIRKVALDEIDGYPTSSGIEGDPVELARARTKTFPNKFVWMFSTPTIKQTSRVQKLWDQSDQRRYFVPCPHCQTLQYLKWRQVKGLKKGQLFGHDPDAARYHCENEKCEGEPWTQADINAAVQKGVWIATKPENKKNGLAGFHIWEIYSPWSSMREIVRAFLACKNVPDQLRVWKNTCLGECDELDGEAIDNESLLARCEAYGGYNPEIPYQRPTVPNDVLVLVASVDRQKDRLEVFVAGFGLDEEMWGLMKIEFPGDTMKGEVWDKVDKFLEEEFTREDGVKLKIETAFVDSADKSANVYAFTKPRRMRKIYACRGSSHPNKPIVGNPSRVGPRRVTLYEIGTDTAKDMIFGRVTMPYQRRDDTNNCPGYIHFPKGFGFDFEYFEQLTAEKCVIKHRNGVPYRTWDLVRPNKRNEALDLMVYAYAAFFNLKADMKRIARKLEQKSKDAKGKAESAKQESGAAPAEASEDPVKADEKPQAKNETPAQKQGKTMRRRQNNFATNWRKF